MLRARETVDAERFTFHSSRMRMRQVTAQELRSMDEQAARCAAELADAKVDVMGYACLVAIMSAGLGYHRESEQRLQKIAQDQGCEAPVVSSAGALIEGLRTLGARRIAMITPYMKPLTQRVAEYIENEGIAVVDALSLEIADNMAVGERDPLALIDIFPALNAVDADVIVLSACVQMPSLASIAAVEALSRKPVISAATCTVYSMLKSLGLAARVPGAGVLLSGRY